MKWEYRKTADMDQDSMNALGNEGWELVAVVQPLKDAQGTGVQGMYAQPKTVVLYWKAELP